MPFSPRAQGPTPLLEQYGRDLCQQALEDNHPIALGRSVELQGVMETLCRWTKRNPLLIGPAGAGKTMVVASLARRIVRNEVPAPLQGMRVISLQTSTLLWETAVVEGLEKRLHALLKEANQDGIILFISDFHDIVHKGSGKQIDKLSSLLKLAMIKEEFTCIATTTDAGFHDISQYQALARRFQPLRINELSVDVTLEILDALRQRAKGEHRIDFSDQALKSIILLGQQHLRNRYFPDKAIEIFEHCVAYALIASSQEVTPVQVSEVVERMVGVPINLSTGLTERLNAVKDRLAGEAFCPGSAAEMVTRRLEIAMRGLDVLPVRPNAILLVAGQQSDASELTAHVLAEALYDDRERLITVDLTQYNQPTDINWLTNASTNDTGHYQALPFHSALTQKPWSVIHFKNVENSHPVVDELLAQAFRSGFIVDAQNRRIYLSDTIVLLTAKKEAKNSEPKSLFGFHSAPEISREENGEEEEEESSLSQLVVKALWDEIDVAWDVEPPSEERLKVWAERWVFPAITERYWNQGLEIQWDTRIMALLAKNVLDKGSLLQGKRLLEEEVLPLLIPHIGAAQKVVLTCDESGSVQIKPGKT